MELNAEQIKKALECCVTDSCFSCHYDDVGVYSQCVPALLKDALALINSQEQRIKELTEENERLRKALSTDISIVRVSRGSGKTAYLREVGRIKVDAIRADTVRKMQERLKVHCVDNRYWCELIDQIAKEILEER